uniref:Uncharacterized protein n=1 Tax=Strigamia maritima TaxID=126957 RepID=T1IUW3_STRMM
MNGILCILLFDLSVLVAVAVGHPHGTPIVKRNIFEKEEAPSREKLIEYLEKLDEDSFNELTDEQKVSLAFLIFAYGIDDSDLEKRSAIATVVKRSLQKRESSGEYEIPSRAEVVDFLKSLDEKSFDEMSEEQRVTLALLIIHYEITKSDLYKRAPIAAFAKRSLKKRNQGPMTKELIKNSVINILKHNIGDIETLTKKEKKNWRKS